MKDKKKENTKKHYTVLLNGEPFKIIGYSIKESGEEKLICLKTKMKSQSFPTEGKVHIELEPPKPLSFDAVFYGKLTDLATVTWYYEML